MTPFRIRILPAAGQDIAQAHAHLVATADVAVADEWETGLFAALRELALTPKRQVAERESRLLGREVRRIVYRRTPSSTAAYHVFFRLIETEGTGGVVEVLHIRHASRRSLGRAEAEARREALEEEA